MFILFKGRPDLLKHPFLIPGKPALKVDIVGVMVAEKIGSCVALSATVLYALCNNLALIFGLSALRGFSEVIILAASYSLSSILIPPAKRARYFGLFNATYFLSWGVAGTLIVGPLTDVLISRGTAEELAYRMAFVSTSVLTLLGLIILGVLLWTMRRSAHSQP